MKMDHIAILRKANIKKGDNLLEDILSGTKTIESRWYVNKVAPWDKIKAKDCIYFKESGCPVIAKVNVSKVLQYENINQKIMGEIVEMYGDKIAPNTSKADWELWASTQTKKNYCILIFLKDIEKIKPFEISKKGYGMSSAWLVTDDVNMLKISA